MGSASPAHSSRCSWWVAMPLQRFGIWRAMNDLGDPTPEPSSPLFSSPRSTVPRGFGRLSCTTETCGGTGRTRVPSGPGSASTCSRVSASAWSRTTSTGVSAIFSDSPSQRIRCSSFLQGIETAVVAVGLGVQTCSNRGHRHRQHKSRHLVHCALLQLLCHVIGPSQIRQSREGRSAAAQPS